MSRLPGFTISEEGSTRDTYIYHTHKNRRGLFPFNPHVACPSCDGLGTQKKILTTR